jgi:predicted MPP superfamily phosphohydrolase
MIKIQYVSDIHLETHHNTSKAIFEKILKPSAPYLALCGDIGYPGAQLYEPFLKYCSENFEQVFYIAGNHEYYNDSRAIKYLKTKQFIEKSVSEEELRRLSAKVPRETPESRNTKIREICSQFLNIHFLDKEIYQIPNTNVIVVGCTLWSQLDMDPYMYSRFNDFNMICIDKDTILTPNVYAKWFEEHLDFIAKTIPELHTKSPDTKIIVLTHHCPTYEIIIDKYRLNDMNNMNSFFANDDLITPFGKNVKLWLCGHTHGCKSINVEGTIVATNTFGYEWETIDGFKPDAVIEI